MTRLLPRAALLSGFLIALGACTDAPSPTDLSPAESRNAAARSVEAGPTIADIAIEAAMAEENAEFTILVQALQAADLVSTLDGKRQFTVFAPTDAAFLRLLDLLGVSAEELLADTELLNSVLLYHVAPGRRLAEDVLDSDQIRTLNGGFVFPVMNDAGAFIVDGAEATADAPIVAADIEASNGVIHVIDEVLVPGEGGRPGGHDDDEGEEEDEGDSEPTIAELVTSLANADEPEFTVLLAAVEAAGLVDALNGDRELTVFAPTDAAFGRLLALLGVTAEELLADTELLTAVLLYHVAPGERDAEVVLESDRIRTLNGGFLYPMANDDGAFIVDGSEATEDAQIIQTDIEAANGIVHVIDEVLVPGM
ncbi:MAG: fasciclin domain-containing protein [Longimicrobiales bacterium]|nr:fasciclin domain-containing protein [Longimicrobiales bacterium]